jgi:hypothetical protein
MKTFAIWAVMTLVQLFSNSSQAYILPLENILQKAAAVAGTSIISVDQEVLFKDGIKTYIVKENWLIEGDRNLRLTARGTGELKDAVNISYVYNNKNRTKLTGKIKTAQITGPDFFERYLAIKSKDSYYGYLKELGIADNVRLSRAGGVICFAVGKESEENNLQPEVWIDQNAFRLMKIRFPDTATVEFTNYAEKDNAHYPRQKTVSWDGKSVSIIVTKVSVARNASIKSFYPDSIENSSTLNAAGTGSIGPVIEEFYQRFR